MPGAVRKPTISPDQEIAILSEISSLVQKSGASLEQVEELLKLLGQIVDFRSASVYIMGGQSGNLEEICNIGRRANLIDFVKFEMGSGISAWVAKHRRPIILNNLRRSKGGTHTRSFLSVPIIFANEIKGVINISHDEPDSYSKRDSELVAIAASLVALLIERVRVKEALAAKENENEGLKSELSFERTSRLSAGQYQASGDFATALNNSITNPLAIIAGNAQFLLMTMKGSDASVLRRLKAIDKEASNILSMTQKMTAEPSEPTKGLTLRMETDNRLFLQTRQRIGKT